MKYNDNGEWKDIQIKVANAIQNEYGESNNDGYSQNYLNDKVVNVSSSVDEDYRVNLLHSNNILEKTTFVNGDYRDAEPSRARRASTRDSIYLEAGTYTCSTDIDLTLYNYAVIMIPNVPPSPSYNAYYDTGWLSVSSTTFTITTPGYFGIQARRTNDADFNASALSSYTFYLTKGSTPTTEPFIQNKIVVDNEKYSDTLNVGQFDSRSRINVLKSKNLLDLQFLQLITNSSGTVISNNNFWDVIVDTRNISSLYISGDFSLIADNTVRVGTYSSYPVLGSTGTRITLQANGAINTSNVNYVLFAFGISSSSVTWDQVKASFMINEGSTALPYEPYIVPSIYVDNEMLVSKNVYSTGEVVIGEWLGKPLYRKVVNFGALPNTSLGQVAHNISNVKDFIKIIGWRTNNSDWATIPFASASSSVSAIQITCNNEYIFIRTSTNMTAYSAYVILEYTKTTD